MSFDRWAAPKDPDDKKDYAIDWTAWLGTDTISNSSWIVPSDLTLESSSATTKTTTIWLSGGVAGTSYHVTNRITTVGGRVEDKTVILKCKDL